MLSCTCCLIEYNNAEVWAAGKRQISLHRGGYDTGATSCRLLSTADMLYSVLQSLPLAVYVVLRWSEWDCVVCVVYDVVESLLFVSVWLLFSKSCRRSEWYMSRLSVDWVSSCLSNCRGDKSLALMNVFLMRTACLRHCSASGIFFSLLMLCFRILVLFSLNRFMMTLQGFSIGSRNGSFFLELRNFTMIEDWGCYQLVNSGRLDRIVEYRSLSGVQLIKLILDTSLLYKYDFN